MRPQRQNDPVLTEQQRQQEARKLRDRFAWLNSFTDQELEEISFCEAGAAMVPGEVYFDISHPEMGAFVGTPGRLIPEDACLVRKSDVSEQLWAKLTAYPPRH